VKVCRIFVARLVCCQGGIAPSTLTFKEKNITEGRLLFESFVVLSPVTHPQKNVVSCFSRNKEDGFFDKASSSSY
jgi:hypothetical protein